MPAEAELIEGDHIRRISCSRVLDDIDLRIGDAIDRRIISVSAVPNGQNTSVRGAPKAWHARHELAEEHLPASVWQRVAKATVVTILGVACKVGAGTPERCRPGAAHEWLESGDRVGDDLLYSTGAVEGPLGVQARHKRQALVLNASLHLSEIGLDIAIFLHAILHTFDLGDRQVLPHARVHVSVGAGHSGLSTEDCRDHVVLFGPGKHLEEHVIVCPVLVNRLPKTPQIARPVAEPSFCLQPLCR
mmetsp:Transcript_138614/g.360271  ORF Transcript_138614/g.360271 Transcript_138614/m.360271 type:complete len:246 (+) Transcript_138614:17-754(+)